MSFVWAHAVGMTLRCESGYGSRVKARLRPGCFEEQLNSRYYAIKITSAAGSGTSAGMQESDSNLCLNS